MKFSELDNRLRVYETAHDFCVPPNIYMVARIDSKLKKTMNCLNYSDAQA